MTGMSKEETEDSSSDSSSGSSSDSSDTESDLGDKQPPGHDPDSVASPGLGMLSPKTHYGSILPMVKGESSVDLSGVKLDEAQVMELSTFIKERDHIREVTLCNTALTDTMFTSLAQSLQASQSSFYLLNLGVNNLGPKSVTQLAPVIKNQAGLKVIILNGNPIGNVGSKLLCDALTKTKDPFPFLRRSSGYLTPSEARKQADEGQAVKYDNSAEEGCNIKQMDLGDCKIGDAGIAEISRFLESNKTLTSLNLNGNKEISPSGWERLGQAFKKNTTLKNLSLDHTDIGDAGIESLAKGLRVNIGLRSLELEHNALTEKGGQILRDLTHTHLQLVSVQTHAPSSRSPRPNTHAPSSRSPRPNTHAPSSRSSRPNKHAPSFCSSRPNTHEPSSRSSRPNTHEPSSRLLPFKHTRTDYSSPFKHTRTVYSFLPSKHIRTVFSFLPSKHARTVFAFSPSKHTRTVFSFLPSKHTRTVFSFLPSKHTRTVFSFLPSKHTRTVFSFLPSKHT
ncbi:RINI-like protein [Mya arenaria]|uniref:RINI-like protein n=1 Tax=Mya arenaria TaxID=6604 RepID=A0ABY7F6Z6_MYAAR|nr:RINI-like protein [Mya arenaria]